MSERLLTAGEVAERLSVAKSTIYAWVHEKRLRHVKLRKSVRFREADIEELVEENIREPQEVSVDVRP